MKIERKETEFQPVTITIETQDELDQLAAMAYVCNFNNTVGSEDVSNTLYQILSDKVMTKYGTQDADDPPVYLEIVK